MKKLIGTKIKERITKKDKLIVKVIKAATKGYGLLINPFLIKYESKANAHAVINANITSIESFIQTLFLSKWCTLIFALRSGFL